MRKIIFAVLFFLAASLSIFAQHPTSAWMHSYTAETSDKKYIFVIRRDREPDFFAGNEYPQSGMYLNDGSTTPLWTVDWRQRVYLPDDGKHVVRFGSLHYSATYREEAFTFFSEGKALRTYRVNELITFPYLLPHSSAGYNFNNARLAPGSENDDVLMRIDKSDGYTLNSGAIIDNEKQTLAIETCHGDNYTFNLLTGEIILSQHPSRNLALALFGVLVIGYAFYLLFAARIKISKTLLSVANCFSGVLISLFLFLIPIISILPYKIPCSSASTPEYPDFWACCYLSVSMLPRYLLTSLNIIAPPEMDMPVSDYTTAIRWFILFWIPCVLSFIILTNLLVSFLKSRRRNLC